MKHTIESVQVVFTAKVCAVRGDYALICRTETSYFTPSGKARLGIKRTYMLYVYTSGDWEFVEYARNKSLGTKALRIVAAA